jgi:hypothetical protein
MARSQGFSRVFVGAESVSSEALRMKFHLIPRSPFSPRIPLIGSSRANHDGDAAGREAQRFQAMSELLALLGEKHPGGIRVDRLGALSGLSEAQTDSALRDLLHAGLVRREGRELVGQTLSSDDSRDRLDGSREP